MKPPSDHGSGDLKVDKHQPRSPQESELLRHIKEVNEKRVQLGYESLLFNRSGNVEGAVKKQRAAEEARRYLKTLFARHKKLYWRRGT